MIRIAIIGAAHPHVEYVLDELRRDERHDFALVGVYDPDPAIAEHYARLFDVPGFADSEELLAEGIDIAVIAGVYGTRGDHVVSALRAGAHVLADKPLCTSLAELEAIEAAAAETGGTVNLLLEKRGYPETIAALAVVRSGELGNIHGITSSGPHKLKRGQRPEWFFDRAQYGGILTDLAVHDLDAALMFAPLVAGSVRGDIAGPLDGAPDFALYGVASVSTPQTVITAEVSWLTPQKSDVHGDYRLRIIGTRGTLEIFWARGRVDVTTAELEKRSLKLPPGLRPAEQALGAFADGTIPQVSTRESLVATRLALLAQHSADHGSELQSWRHPAS
ncbi:Gfo/Idh/MocA family protein [Paramicrobacterium fandaimingii]|uniref:Gfo/Idh/MocA family protein n=1 Tax=Paramicrobacterium fandaimingii TaxID=2708079 RepID=UPI001420666A|nr:Gfo/Idh/MocA family oxidoreductase [Microbacterium fandaimingii]